MHVKLTDELTVMNNRQFSQQQKKEEKKSELITTKIYAVLVCEIDIIQFSSII